MVSEEETRQVVEGYFSAWTRNKPLEAYEFLAEDLAFAGPTAKYESREAFKPALVGFAAMSKAAHVIELLVVGDRAALLYDCDLPEPVGTTRIASFFRVKAGKIIWYETFFDATELRKLQARKSG
jgi:hypothetical protein